MNSLTFDIEDKKQYEYLKIAVFSIIKMKALCINVGKYNGDMILNGIIGSKFYLWNYEFYPEGYPFFGGNIKIHGAFNRELILPSDYISLSFKEFFDDIMSFVKKEVCLKGANRETANQNFLNEVKKEISKFSNNSVYYKLKLELNLNSNFTTSDYEGKISEWYPFSIFKSYIVFNRE